MSNIETDDLEYIKIKLLTSKNSFFFGSILCDTDIKYSDTIERAVTNGESILVNKDWFSTLTKEERLGTVLHELWHIARLHTVDIKVKNHRFWNIACDCIINSALIKDGYKLPKDVYTLKKFFGSHNVDITEEEVYSYLCNNYEDSGSEELNNYSNYDLKESENTTKIINKVSQAITTANLNTGNNTLEEFEKILYRILKPKVDWKRLLREFLTDNLEEDITWRKRNRRYRDIYLPGKEPEEGRLEHLAYFIDVSGSIESEDIQRITSELYYIYKEIKPRKMSIIQFDVKINKIDILKEGDSFNLSEIYGRGGTSYKCVHKWIEENKPTCSIIFTDLYAEPMEKVKSPVLWIVYNNTETKPTFGKHIIIEN